MSTTPPGPGTTDRTSFVRVYWSARDQYRVVTMIGLTGLALAAAMATSGLPPIDIHGPFHRFGIMDPLCGGTRAARLTAQGHLADAWRYNPLGILAVLAAAAAALRLGVGILAGQWLSVEIAWTRRRVRVALIVVLILTAVLEIRQQGRADLLLKPY